MHRTSKFWLHLITNDKRGTTAVTTLHDITCFNSYEQYKSAAFSQDDDFLFCRQWSKWTGKWNNHITVVFMWADKSTAAWCCLTSMLSALKPNGVQVIERMSLIIVLIKICFDFPGLHHQGVLEWWQHRNHLQTLQQVLRPAGECAPRLGLSFVFLDSSFPAVETCISQEGSVSALIQHCPPVDLVNVAKSSLLHPYDTGNYIVRQESENVPTELTEDSDECGDHTDDHRNVWIILECHVGSVCCTRRESH